MITNPETPQNNENKTGTVNPVSAANLPQPVSAPNPVTSVNSQKPKILPVVLLIALAIVGVGIGGLAVFTKQKISPANNSIVPTPTQLIQINSQNIDPVATSSAFLNLESMLADLNASISAYNPEDQSIAPPVLDLSLGFQN